MDLTLNNLQWLICYQTKPNQTKTKPNQTKTKSTTARETMQERDGSWSHHHDAGPE